MFDAYLVITVELEHYATLSKEVDTLSLTQEHNLKLVSLVVRFQELCKLFIEEVVPLGYINSPFTHVKFKFKSLAAVDEVLLDLLGLKYLLLLTHDRILHAIRIQGPQVPRLHNAEALEIAGFELWSLVDDAGDMRLCFSNFFLLF